MDRNGSLLDGSPQFSWRSDDPGRAASRNSTCAPTFTTIVRIRPASISSRSISPTCWRCGRTDHLSHAVQLGRNADEPAHRTRFPFFSRRLFVGRPRDFQGALSRPWADAQARGDPGRLAGVFPHRALLPVHAQSCRRPAAREYPHGPGRSKMRKQRLSATILPPSMGIQLAGPGAGAALFAPACCLHVAAELAAPARRRQRIPAQAMPSSLDQLRVLRR